MSFLWPEEGDFPENLRRVVCVVINKPPFESFMCLDLVFCMPTFSVYENTREKKKVKKIINISRHVLWLVGFPSDGTRTHARTHACTHTHTGFLGNLACM